MLRPWLMGFCFLCRCFGRVGGYRCVVPGQTCAFVFCASADSTAIDAPFLVRPALLSLELRQTWVPSVLLTELCRTGLVILPRLLGFVVPRNFWAESDFIPFAGIMARFVALNFCCAKPLLRQTLVALNSSRAKTVIAPNRCSAKTIVAPKL